MSRTVCCVCEKPIEGEVKMIGNRPYDAACYAKVMRNRGGLWLASLIGVAGLVVFVGLTALILKLTNAHPQGLPLVIIGVVVSLVPALIWLGVFYLQDVREPEPKNLVLAVFVLGGLLAQAVGLPLINQAFHIQTWLLASPLIHILGAVLVGGFINQFLVYATVRYSVYYSEEFDERIDGIIYAVAAALGYATVVSINYVVSSGGVNLVNGTIRIAVTALAMASFGGLIGFFLGRCKFEDEPAWWMPAGLVLAAVLNGLFTYLWGELSTTTVTLSGGGHSPIPGLALGAGVAVVTFGILFWLIQRLGRRAEIASA